MRRFSLLLLLLAASACGPIVQVGGNAPRPEALYTLTAPAPAAVSAGIAPIDQKRAVTVDVPTVPGVLQTMRIPVQVSETAVQYIVGAQWSEQPNRLFQRLLAEVIANGGVPVIDQRAAGKVAPSRLSGQLLTFGLDSRGSRQVVARYDATFTTPEGVRQRRFERSAPISSADPALVADALNGVANQLAADVAKWVAAAA